MSRPQRRSLQASANLPDAPPGPGTGGPPRFAAPVPLLWPDRPARACPSRGHRNPPTLRSPRSELPEGSHPSSLLARNIFHPVFLGPSSLVCRVHVLGRGRFVPAEEVMPWSECPYRPSPPVVGAPQAPLPGPCGTACGRPACARTRAAANQLPDSRAQVPCGLHPVPATPTQTTPIPGHAHRKPHPRGRPRP